MLDKKCITQITCGIQFSNSFKLFDKWGEIADDILSSSSAKKLFGENYYNQISKDVGYQRALFNDVTMNTLRLTQNNLIITHNVTENNFDADYNFIKSIVFKHVFPNIISKHILLVRRVGIVFECVLNETQIGKYRKMVISPAFCDSVTDFRFSKKETTAAGSARQDNDNYINKIITVGNIGDNKHGISYDYQYFFVPPNAQADKTSETVFCKAIESLDNDIFKKIGDAK